jgi:hypothetical protein
MVTDKTKIPSHSIPQVNTSLSIDSHKFHYEHVFITLPYVVRTSSHTSTQHASTHSESTFSSLEPGMLTIPHISTILK